MRPHMTTVLLLIAALFLFLAALKLGDALRDIAFEIRETRRMLEKRLASAEKFQNECWEWLRTDPERRTEEMRRKARPTLEEALEDAGLREGHAETGDQALQSA